MCVSIFSFIFSVDGTQSDGFGRLVNDIDTEHDANAISKVVMVDNTPRICLFAKKNLTRGEELRYDYGVPNLPWRRKVKWPSMGRINK